MSKWLIAQMLVGIVADRQPSLDSMDPLAKYIVKQMDLLISEHAAWDNYTEWSVAQKPFWTEDFAYETVEGFPWGGNYTGLWEWFSGEHMPFNLAFWPLKFNQQMFVGEMFAGSTTTYANAKWIAPMGQLDPGSAVGTEVVIRICDFYRLVSDPFSPFGARISYNWMMIDMVDLLLQAGRRVLPQPRLPERLSRGVHPPSAFDGVPAPNSFFVKSDDTWESRRVVEAMLKHEWVEQKGVSALWADDLTWYGPVGLGVASNKAEYQFEFIEKLRSAFSSATFEIDVLACEGHFCGVHGVLHGTHVGEFLGQPATGKRVTLRIGSHFHVRDGQIVEGWSMMDFPALFKQFGVDLFSRTGPPAVAVSPLAPAAYNNDCMIDTQLNPPTKDAPQTFLAECAAWVIKSTDAVWHAHERVDESIEEYFYEDWFSSSDVGIMRGMKALKQLVHSKRTAFPDLKIHITDAFCHGNDIDGYKTTMPDILTGTNTGPSDFGPATNRSVIYRGIAVCYVQKVRGRWQYVAEWVLHDAATYMLQMGWQPKAAPKPELRQCKQNLPSWGWQAPMAQMLIF